MTASETYLDIVWAQFKKNRFALAALWVMAPLFLAAIFAPLLASSQPLVFYDGRQTLFPWFRTLFNPEEAVDFAFNMFLVSFLPSTLIALGLNARWRRRGLPGLRRLLRAAGIYVALAALLGAACSLDAVRPNNRYLARSFAEEQLEAARSGAAKTAFYPPIPLGPTDQDVDSIFKPPGFRKDPGRCRSASDGFPHFLGTDNVGRDVLVQMLYGTRISLTVGFVAVGIYMIVGVIVGAVAGYFGGWADMVISRAIEIVMLFPSFFLILTLVGLLGPSIYIIMFVIGITGWPSIARLIRGEVLKQRGIDYVAAAQALGASHTRIIFRHILPNALTPALVAIPFGIAGAIVTEAGLSLLGFGVRPPTPSWGTLLKLGSENYSYWWLVVIPSLAMFLSVTVFNLVGSGLRDAMDPKLRI
jgi:peptide/nickel transport system permease protein